MNSFISQNGVIYQQVDISSAVSSLILEQSDAQAAVDHATRTLAEDQATLTAATAKLDAINQQISDLQSQTDPTIIQAISTTPLAPVSVTPTPVTPLTPQ